MRERTEPPYPGFWALPGGLRCPGTSLDAQARALQVGITAVEGGWIEQLKTFHRPQQTDQAGRVRGVHGLRLARLPDSERAEFDAEILAAYDRSLKELAAMGAEIVDLAEGGRRNSRGLH